MRCYLPLFNSHPQWNKPCWSCSSTRKKSAYSSKASLREALKLGREHIKQQVKRHFPERLLSGDDQGILILHRVSGVRLGWPGMDQRKSVWKYLKWATGCMCEQMMEEEEEEEEGTNASGVCFVVCVQVEHEAHCPRTKISIICWQNSSQLLCFDSSTSVWICLLKGSYNYRICARWKVRPDRRRLTIRGLSICRICVSVRRVCRRLLSIRRSWWWLAVVSLLLTIRTRCRISVVVGASSLSIAWGLLRLLLPALPLGLATVRRSTGIPVWWHRCC